MVTIIQTTGLRNLYVKCNNNPILSDIYYIKYGEMGTKEKKGCVLFYLGKTKEDELMSNFDRIYDTHKFLALKKGFLGEIKFVESLETIYIYVKIV